MAEPLARIGWGLWHLWEDVKELVRLYVPRHPQYKLDLIWYDASNALSALESHGEEGIHVARSHLYSIINST